jgi:hypothetical protein
MNKMNSDTYTHFIYCKYNNKYIKEYIFEPKDAATFLIWLWKNQRKEFITHSCFINIAISNMFADHNTLEANIISFSLEDFIEELIIPNIHSFLHPQMTKIQRQDYCYLFIRDKYKNIKLF